MPELHRLHELVLLEQLLLELLYLSLEAVRVLHVRLLSFQVHLFHVGPAFALKLINPVTELLRPAFLGGELVSEALEGAVGCPQLRILLLNY